jgi:hypothetical protein
MIRFITAVVILLWSALPLRAQTEPRFLIERIDVRNSTRSAEIVRAESRLEEGQSYTERELREASYRINRLPFVYDSTYSLEKGSRRDAYVFVVTITATEPLFYSADLGVRPQEKSLNGDLDAVAGGRMFLGRRGVAHVAVSRTGPLNHNELYGASTVEVGYTQYDLFGTRAFATASVGMTIARSGDTNPYPTLLVGLPISRNQTLTARYSSSSFESPADAEFYQRSRNRSSNLTWTYNTTDHPFFPTRGELVSASYDNVSFSFVHDLPAGPDPQRFETAGESERLLLTGAKYWRLTERNTVWGELDAVFSRDRSDSSNIPGNRNDFIRQQQRMLVGAGHSLRDARASRKYGESRLEGTYELIRFDAGFESPLPGVLTEYSTNRFTAAWAWRTAIGSVRLRAAYEW